MAKYQGELRDRRPLCYAAGCEDFAVCDKRFPGLCILCTKHWDEKLSGVDVLLAGDLEPALNARYLVAKGRASVTEPRKMLRFRALPVVPGREAKP